MTNGEDTGFTSTKARGDVAAERACICCKTTFWSEGFGQRICVRCKARKSWQSGIATDLSKGRRRPSGGAT